MWIIFPHASLQGSVNKRYGHPNFRAGYTSEVKLENVTPKKLAKTNIVLRNRKEKNARENEKMHTRKN